MPRAGWTLLLLALSTSGVLAQRTTPQPEIESLLRPRALPAAPAWVSPREFADPPADYRSMPLWVWNDELEWPRLAEQLEQFRRQGMGGVFVHPRPGLMTEYLGADWFRLWKLAAGEGRRLGISVNIYDENSYPSGFAGGHVPAHAPDTAAQFVQAEENVPAQRVAWSAADTVAVFAQGRRVRSAAEMYAGETVTVFRLRRASGNPWTAGFPYVDLTHPDTARQFLETTFEPYRRHLGAEFGKTIRWVFDDEPLLATGGAYDRATLALPLSFHTMAEFRRRCGYDLADHLPSLYRDTGDFRRVRFDYWQTLHDLWKENYFRPLFQWCDRNGLQFTGHWMEHEWPFPWISPADASLYAYEHVPGIDMLEGANLRTKGADPHMLFTVKQVASVAHQLGRRAFCEAYGVSGWDATLEHFKRFGDWLMVHGVNFMNQHLAFATVRGARKRDHPQSFSDISPWWPYYRLHGDHLARVSYLLGRGESRNRLLALVPTTSGFLWARRGEPTPELDQLRHDNAELMQWLADHQVDFDLGDEYILEWFGGLDGRRLAVGRARYDLLLWPRHMSNVRRQTVPLLERYLGAGGEVIALGPPAAYVDGRPDPRVAELRRKFAKQWHDADPDALAGAIGTRLPPRVRFEPPLPAGVGLNERFYENGDRTLFLANTGLASARATATLEGGAVELWDTVNGRIAPAPFERAGGRLRMTVELPPAGSLMLLVKASGPASDAAGAGRWGPVAAGAWKATADSLNVLVLDYCDLSAPGLELRDVHTWRANWLLWQAHGFERPAWDNAVQFRTRVFDRNHFPAGSGFEATFRFTVADAAALAGLELAVESPELYRVTVNGAAVDFGAGARWLDPHIRSGPAIRARVGENQVKIVGRPFDVRMELENIYLRGRFAVAAAERGFRLAAPRRLEPGSWARQGYPFYADAVTYASEITVPGPASRLRVELPRWQGSVAAVLLDGRQVVALGWPPYTAEFAASPGRHTLAIRIVSTPRNLFGPFHNRSKPRMRAWPAAWSDFPERQPPGAAYDLLDYGLMQPPAVTAEAP